MNAIEIYENADRKLNKSEITLGEYERMIDPLRNVIPIPEGATNGNMIKIMFPNVESRLDKKTGIILVKWSDGTTKTFKTSWWNAPYKVGGKE